MGFNSFFSISIMCVFGRSFWTQISMFVLDKLFSAFFLCLGLTYFSLDFWAKPAYQKKLQFVAYWALVTGLCVFVLIKYLITFEKVKLKYFSCVIFNNVWKSQVKKSLQLDICINKIFKYVWKSQVEIF